MAVTIDGLVTGIDTEKIIGGLLKIQKQQVDRFELQRVEVQRKQTAFRGIESRLLTLRSDLSRLSRSQNNPFIKQIVTVSDETAIAASASDSATAGIYQLKVETKARAHQVASQGFADPDAQITQGTMELRTGTSDPKTITIDANNYSLSGLATAINAAGAGVTASIVKDSSGGASPYRLVLASTRTGVANQITLTNNLAASSGSAVRPVIDFATPVQAAADAQITLGSGAGAITVSSTTNRFENVIAGVTVDLLQVSAGEEVSLTVARDSESAVDAVTSFVKSFNDAMQYIDDQSLYKSETDQAGLLLGNRTAISVQQKLRAAVLGVVPGVSSYANRLSSLGISVSDKGRLVLNETKLQDIMDGRNENISAADAKRLFALDASSTNSGVSFVLGTGRTKASTTPYQVDITQAAEQASLTASTNMAASTEITTANRELELRLDGATATVKLNPGTYTPQQLADHVESVLNSVPTFAGRNVLVGLNADKLTLKSESFGISSELQILSGSALAALGLTAGQNAVGRDVAGHFLVDGVTEIASGRGRLLSGNSENENTADLQLRITLTPGQVTAGTEADVTVTRGLAASLDEILGELLEAKTGTLASADEGFTGQIESIQKTLDRQTAVFERQQASLIRQFVALESAISKLRSTSDFVGSQLAGLAR